MGRGKRTRSPSPVPSTSKAALRQDGEEEHVIVDEGIVYHYEWKDDGKVLKGIFPAEIWTIILDLVTDPTVFENVCNSSTFFRDILKPKRTELLFPEVFQILCNNINGTHPKPKYKLDVPSEHFRRRNVFPRQAFIPCYNHKREILNLRLVSSAWKNTVDHFYQHLPQLYEMNLRSGQLEGKWHIATLHQRRDILRFMDHFRNTHAGNNPFIGRAVSLYSSARSFPHPPLNPMLAWEDNSGSLFRTAMNNLLWFCGRHIWHLTIHINDKFPRTCEYYDKLKTWLTWMPNLKGIRIIFKIPSTTGWNDRRPPYLAPDELYQLPRSIAASPLPKLDALEFIYAKNVPLPLLHELLTKSNVSMLEVEGGGESLDSLHFTLGRAPITNLTQLSIEICGTQVGLLKSSQEGWNLQKICLDFKDRCYRSASWPAIFTALEEKWSGTVVDVTLKLPEVRNEKDMYRIMLECFQYKLNLPLLKRFKATIFHYSTLDFLLPMTNTLEELNITAAFKFTHWNKTKVGRLVEHSQKIQFLGYFNRMLESNIWTLFPKLKRIDLVETYLQPCRRDPQAIGVQYSKSSYTRNQWESEQVMTGNNAIGRVIKRSKMN